MSWPARGHQHASTAPIERLTGGTRDATVTAGSHPASRAPGAVASGRDEEETRMTFATTGGGWRSSRTGWALCATLVLLMAIPAAASACPNWARVKAFHGHADTAFDESTSGSDNGGGTVTVELHRSGSVKIDMSTRVPKHGSGRTEFLGGSHGGILRVHDTYTDDTGSGSITGEQTADGPGVHPSLTFLELHPSSCTYQLHMMFSVKATSSGEWPSPPDLGAGGVAVTPARHIPSNLKLFGTADVPAYYDGCSGRPHHGGCYEFEGFLSRYAWPQEFDMLKTCGSIVATSCGPSGQKEGTASFSWSLSPAAPPKPKKKKHHK